MTVPEQETKIQLETVSNNSKLQVRMTLKRNWLKPEKLDLFLSIQMHNFDENGYSARVLPGEARQIAEYLRIYAAMMEEKEHNND